ncbi:RtcB family protein [Acinetobacter rudis]|uniref:3'-phosphate/5'-hydroxy nucleic acid ligase n=1 Tax=Acinetobacter rudis TaxID=632955 RepID=A0AAW8J9P0_9GAMM|nr:RtcB family protein [Acinetobacter rudis]MDQ8936232.1 RtcB family protein [Acinetobacter rudis]MDQ8953946.1 RtcB family protein [Acinetobacter rudis]MDQ9018495.1 RtcB family protein [Acinetobacter rudis]
MSIVEEIKQQAQLEQEQQRAYQVLKNETSMPVKMWTNGVIVDDNSKRQLLQTAQMPFIYKWMAVMPDVHFGLGATIGSVIPTKGAIIPAAVGVDIGCGMMATRTSLTASDLPDHLYGLRTELERLIPHGMTKGHGRDRGSWETPPELVDQAWADLVTDFELICSKYPRLKNTNNRKQLGTLGTGNHFVEICLDEHDHVWIMLHSGSRGVGNAIGNHFIELARKDMQKYFIHLPNKDLAYLVEGTEYFDDYWFAVGWAQRFAMKNREIMMQAAIKALATIIAKPFNAKLEAVNCHHNYVQKEEHYGEEVMVTRKGAVSAKRGQYGIIPGSMGAKSFIVRGLGNQESFCSCSHGAGRVMSRTEAKRRFTVEDQIAQTEGVECRKDKEVIDEIPSAYKPIEDVMKAQSDLVEVVYTLRQVVCVKG